MKNYFFKILLSISMFFLLLFPVSASAVYDPLSTPNNKIGIHILFPTELNSAKELVNSSGGDWGYVTIPIQAGDKDIKKWQGFMDEARKLHLIPILRLATHGDYFQKESWKKPTEADVLDFANFLNSLEWPVKNRYIIVFNEVNRADEWQGEANPAEYARILSYASSIFKKLNPDFFIISSGMDNAAATSNETYSQYDYFREMNNAVPGVFNQIDGFGSHSYPNPGFSSLPDKKTRMSIASFTFELAEIDRMTDKNLPVFITETGWDQTLSSDRQVGDYFRSAFEGAWKDSRIVAITPFLLHAGQGPFEKFSLIRGDGSKNEIFRSIESYNKTAGAPVLNNSIKNPSEESINLPVKNFSRNSTEDEGKELKLFVKWLLIPI